MAEGKEKVIASELRDRNDAELQSMLSEKVDELHGVKFKKSAWAIGSVSPYKAAQARYCTLEDYFERTFWAGGLR